MLFPQIKLYSRQLLCRHNGFFNSTLSKSVLFLYSSCKISVFLYISSSSFKLVKIQKPSTSQLFKFISFRIHICVYSNFQHKILGVSMSLNTYHMCSSLQGDIFVHVSVNIKNSVHNFLLLAFENSILYCTKKLRYVKYICGPYSQSIYVSHK